MQTITFEQFLRKRSDPSKPDAFLPEELEQIIETCRVNMLVSPLDLYGEDGATVQDLTSMGFPFRTAKKLQRWAKDHCVQGLPPPPPPPLPPLPPQANPVSLEKIMEDEEETNKQIAQLEEERADLEKQLEAIRQQPLETDKAPSDDVDGYQAGGGDVSSRPRRTSRAAPLGRGPNYRLWLEADSTVQKSDERKVFNSLRNLEFGYIYQARNGKYSVTNPSGNDTLPVNMSEDGLRTQSANFFRKAEEKTLEVEGYTFHISKEHENTVCPNFGTECRHNQCYCKENHEAMNGTERRRNC